MPYVSLSSIEFSSVRWTLFAVLAVVMFGCSDEPTGDETDAGWDVGESDKTDTAVENGDAGGEDTTDTEGDEATDAGDDTGSAGADADTTEDTGLCDDGLQECDGTCVDVDTDPNHCGTCNHTCGDRQICDDGECICNPVFFVDCEGVCANFASDDDFCGACDNSCQPYQTCNSGRCENDCSDDETVCDDECTNITTDPNSCGECDQTCETDIQDAEPVCDQGECGVTCTDNMTLCEDAGTCANLDENADHCGRCGVACSTDVVGADAECVDGYCLAVCEGDDEKICGGECVDADTECQWELVDEFTGIEWPQSAAISRDGSTIAYSNAADYGEHRFCVHDADTGDKIWCSKGEGGEVRGVGLGKRGDYLATAQLGPGSSRGLHIYDIDDETLTGSNTVTNWAMRSVAVSPHGLHAAWGRGSGQVRYRSIPDAEFVASHSSSDWRAYDIDYSQHHVVHTHDDGVDVLRYTIDDYTHEETFSSGSTRLGVAIADDDSFVAYQTSGGHIRVHEVGDDWSETTTLSVEGEFEAIAASGQGRFLAVEDPQNDEIVIYETDGFSEFQRLDDCGTCSPSYDHSDNSDIGGAHTNIGFSAAGDRLVVPSAADDTVYLYELTAVP